MNRWKKISRNQSTFRSIWPWMMLLFLVPGLACDFLTPKSDQCLTSSEDPTTYVAEVENVSDVWIPVNAAGNYDEADRVMGVDAKMQYVLTFPRDGGPAIIEKVYTPYKVDGVIDEERFSEAEVKAMMSRTDFPTSRETVYNLTFFNELKSDSKYGRFESDTVQGTIRKEYEKTAGKICQIFYVDFNQGITQTYRIVEPPYPTWGYQR